MLKTLNIGEVVFELGDEIGSDGKNSQTFKARDVQLDANIVMKRMEKAKMSSPDRFFRESKLLYRSAHPNVCQIHYACHDKDYVYVAMPYYKNGSLKNWMAKEHLTVREIVVCGTQIASGLHNIHSKGLVHFDVKPDNILLSDRGEAILSDFGQAAQLNAFGKAMQPSLYSKGIAPEATTTNVYDGRFDIYQLGLTLYRMANGNEKFLEQFSKFMLLGTLDLPAFGQALSKGTFPDRDLFLPHIPTSLRTMIRTCLEVDPKKRYPTAIAASNALATIKEGLLDWRYRSEPAKAVWTRNGTGTSYEVTRHADGRTECYRIAESGQRRKDNKGFMPNVSDTQMRTLLGGL